MAVVPLLWVGLELSAASESLKMSVLYGMVPNLTKEIPCKGRQSMRKNVYCFAGHTVEASTLHSLVHKMCREYQTQDPPEFCLFIDQNDIEEERRRSQKAGPNATDRWQGSSDAYLETLAVYRKLAESLIDKNILLFHGSAVAVDGVCYLFAAKSGTGKSTHARYWRELLGERVVMVNDDKPLLEITDAGITVWGTPWDGKHHLSSNIGVPLHAICLLERGESNLIESISAQEAWPVLWRQAYRPSEPDKLRKTMSLTDTLSKQVYLYRLHCTPNIQAARIAYEVMSKGESL